MALETILVQHPQLGQRGSMTSPRLQVSNRSKINSQINNYFMTLFPTTGLISLWYLVKVRTLTDDTQKLFRIVGELPSSEQKIAQP